MNSFPHSALTRSRRRLVVLLIAITLAILALAGILSGTTARAASIYASIPKLGVIERYDAITGADLGAFATHLATPGGMVFDRAGNLYVNETGSATIRKISPNGNASVFYTGGAIKGSNALAIDANGSIYVANYITNSILRITTARFLSTFIQGDDLLSARSLMAFDSSGNLFATRGGKILKITAEGNRMTFYSGGELGGLAIDRDDSLFVTDIPTGNLNRILPNGTLSVVVTKTYWRTESLILGGGGDVLFTRLQNIYRGTTAGNISAFASAPSRTGAITIGPNPIPEPTTLSLSLIGLSGCCLNTRRARRFVVR